MLYCTTAFVFLILESYVTLADGGVTNGKRHDVRHFPEGFIFGSASASYQVEGAWDEDGKSENIWDHMTHEDPCVIADCSNGDVAGDSYHQYERDVEMMRELGLDHYRFSLSWTRILPTSFPDKINEAGVAYYNNLINEMLKYNIKPMVTLFHFDLPQKLQELGGWTNPYIVDWFADYARVAFELFGDRVKYWITMNEPREFCYQGYGVGTLMPRISILGIAEYMCAKNQLLAHAKAYHIYDEEFRAFNGGTIGITLSAQWYEPDSNEYAEAAEISNLFEVAQYAHPIFSESGDFPPIMKERIAAKSAAQGYPRSRLPELTPEEVEYIRGSSDFFGLNHYTTFLVRGNESVNADVDALSFHKDLGSAVYQHDEWEGSAADLIKIVPWGFYNLLMKIKEEYDNPIVYITENGFPTRGGLQDDDRVFYHREYLYAVLDAIDDGANVQGYTAWCFIDTFEWMEGYTMKFGLYQVDFESPEKTRTPRKFAFVYKEIIRSRSLDWNYEPDTTLMTIDGGH